MVQFVAINYGSPIPCYINTTQIKDVRFGTVKDTANVVHDVAYLDVGKAETLEIIDPASIATLRAYVDSVVFKAS